MKPCNHVSRSSHLFSRPSHLLASKLPLLRVLWAFLVLIGSVSAPLSADAPPLPCRVYGELPESAAGALVSAEVDGVEVTTTSFVDGNRTVYVIDVPGDDPSTVPIEGATEGAVITFHIDGAPAVQSATWASAQAVQTELQPTATPGGPVANDSSVTSLEDVPVALELSATDPDGQPLTFSVVTGPTHGTLTGTPPHLTYQPQANWNGDDGFTFEASDGAASDLGTVSLQVDPVPDPPRLDAIPTQVLDAGSTLQVPILATDADGHVITLDAFGLPSFAGFQVTGNGVGALTLAPGFGDAGTYGGVRIVASDGSFSDEVTFTVQVLATSGPPVAQDQSSSTPEDTPLPLTLTAADPDGDAITYVVASPPTHGVLTGTAPQLVYTPDADFFGADSFTFTASDAGGTSAPATVSLQVEPVADAPVLETLQDVAFNEGAEVELPVLASDADGDPLSFAVQGLPPFASFEDLGDGVGHFLFSPGFDDAGVYPGLQVTVSDGALDASQTFELTVNDFQSPPLVDFRPSEGFNVARLGEATVEAVSSYRGSGLPERAIDGIPNSAWSSDGTVDQWLRVGLVGSAGGTVHVVDRVVLRGRGTTTGLRNFEIRVSTTGSDPADFTTVFSGEVPQDNLDHDFTFPPVQARFVELYAVDTWGSTVGVDVFNFEVHSRPRQGGIVSLLGSGAAVADVSSVGQDPQRAFDLDDQSRWQSANGSGPQSMAHRRAAGHVSPAGGPCPSGGAVHRQLPPEL